MTILFGLLVCTASVVTNDGEYHCDCWFLTTGASHSRNAGIAQYDVITNEWEHYPDWKLRDTWDPSFLVVIDDVLFAAGIYRFIQSNASTTNHSQCYKHTTYDTYILCNQHIGGTRFDATDKNVLTQNRVTDLCMMLNLKDDTSYWRSCPSLPTPVCNLAFAVF
jgi:hypothetical protein